MCNECSGANVSRSQIDVYQRCSKYDVGVPRWYSTTDAVRARQPGERTTVTDEAPTATVEAMLRFAHVEPAVALDETSARMADAMEMSMMVDVTRTRAMGDVTSVRIAERTPAMVDVTPARVDVTSARVE